MIPELFVFLAAWGALAAVLANVRARRPAILSLPFQIIGFVTAELARFHLALQVLATAAWIVAGALDEPIGFVGLGLCAVNWPLLELAHRRSHRAGEVVRSTLEAHGIASEPFRPDPKVLRRPLRHSRPHVTVTSDIAYGEHRRNRLDLHVPEGTEGAPIMIQIHGGAWVSGRKEQQGRPLLGHLGDRGWVGVAINYRLGPKSRFPDPLVDVKRAIAWTREHAPEWGGDPDRIFVTGGSAGGHLSALAALTVGDPTWQPGFEAADCSITGAIPIYGVYDLTDRGGHRGRAAMTPFLERMVMPTKLTEDPEGWERLSPIALASAHAPPMMVISCALDVLVPIEETRDFVRTAQEIGADLVHVELPHAQHAYDVFASPRSLYTADAIASWCAYVASRGEIRTA